MKERCLNRTDKSFKNYGGRGIKVCPEWLEFEPFYAWALANGYQKGLSIERIDNDGNYEPGNCKWADRDEQANNKRTSHRMTYQGQTKTIAQWASALGINAKTLYTRIYCGWSIEKALTTGKGGKIVRVA